MLTETLSEAVDRLTATRGGRPALDVERVLSHRPVEILDRVRAMDRAVECSGDAEALKRERLVQSLPHRGRRSGVLGLEGAGQPLESTLCKARVE